MWEGPVLLWSGPAHEVPPACPEEAPEIYFEGFDGLSTAQSCPSCSCSASACLFPEGVAATSVQGCSLAPEESFVTWNVPDEWDGTCIRRDTPIPGSNTTSIRYTRTRLSPCEPITGEEPVVAEVSWESRALACELRAEHAEIKPPPGFRRCVARRGEVVECPAAHPERWRLFGGADADLGCTPCSCGEPQGGACRGRMDVYKAPGCAWEDTVGVAIVTLSGGGCHTWLGDPNAPHPPIAGMKAEWEVNAPGSCAPEGGAPVGQARPIEPTTFCCDQPW